jgi:hypothetical protein
MSAHRNASAPKRAFVKQRVIPVRIAAGRRSKGPPADRWVRRRLRSREARFARCGLPNCGLQ